MKIYYIDHRTIDFLRSSKGTDSNDILMKILTELYNINSDSIKIFSTENGKKYIKKIENKSIFFSVSYFIDGMILSIANSDHGIDIESIRKIDANIANRFFMKAEIEYIANANNFLDKELLYIWTRKEAYTKAKGITLFEVLSKIDVVSDVSLKKLDCRIKTFFYKYSIISYCYNKKDDLNNFIFYKVVLNAEKKFINYVESEVDLIEDNPIGH